MRVFLMVVFLVAAPVAWASCEMSSARLGNQVLKIGDSERRVLEHKPDRTVQLQNRYGGAAGVRYDFYLRHKTILVYVSGGRIDRVCQVKD